MTAPRPVHCVEYKDDDGNWCFAIVTSRNEDGSFNLLYKAHTGGWESANDVPDGDRVK